MASNLGLLAKKNNVSDFTDESWNSQTGNTTIIRSNFKVYISSKCFRCFEMPRFALIEKPLHVDSVSINLILMLYFFLNEGSFGR